MSGHQTETILGQEMLNNLQKYAEEQFDFAVPASSNSPVVNNEKEDQYKPFPKFTTDEDDGYERANVGIASLIESTKKLLAVNRGEAEPDERDSLKYKRIYNVDDLLAERTRMDAGKIRNAMMYKLSKARSLKNMPSGIFDSYMKGHIIGNPLSLPSEEINPIYLLDLQSKATVFGEGGIGNPDAVTPESQNVHPSQFGLIDPLASPDGMRAGSDVRLANGTRITNNGKLITRLRNRKTGKIEWLTPDEIAEHVVGFPE